MEILGTAVIALSVGLIFGININRKKKPLSLNNNDKNLDANFQTSNSELISSINTSKNGLTVYFDVIELRFLIKLIEDDNQYLTVNETNEILRIEKLSKENQRQRRHLFLKELNMKLKMIFNINECIERESTEYDRRAKSYTLSTDVDRAKIIDLLKNNNK